MMWKEEFLSSAPTAQEKIPPPLLYLLWSNSIDICNLQLLSLNPVMLDVMFHPPIFSLMLVIHG